MLEGAELYASFLFEVTGELVPVVIMDRASEGVSHDEVDFLAVEEELSAGVDDSEFAKFFFGVDSGSF